MDEEGAPEAGLCGACGLCCDGSLFSHGGLTPEEEPAARRALLRVYTEDGTLGFEQPCAAHRGDRCAAYAERPAVCVDYRCTLLRRYEAGEVGRAEALARIAEARRLVAGLRALAGAGKDDRASGKDLWSAVSAHIDATGGMAERDTIAWRRAQRALLFEAAVVKTYLRRHFREDLPEPTVGAEPRA